MLGLTKWSSLVQKNYIFAIIRWDFKPERDCELQFVEILKIYIYFKKIKKNHSNYKIQHRSDVAIYLPHQIGY